MSGKLTYKELEDRVQELEQEEMEHKQAQEELSQIFSMSIDMICIADINTATFIKVNPAFTEILGHSEESLLNKPFLDFVHPDDMDATKTVIEERLQSGAKVINFENRYRCKNGSYRWLSWVSHPNPERGVTYAVARDITELKKDKESLRKSKDLLDATGRMAKIGGWEVDVNTMDLSWTDETYRIHQIPIGHTLRIEDAIKFFHPEDRPQLEQAIQRSLNLAEPYDMEIRFITANGKHLWTRTKCQPEIVNGEIVKLKGTFQDITDRKQAEEELRSSQERLKSIIDSAPFGAHIYQLKDDRKLIFSGFNMAAENILGIKHEQFIDKPIEEAFPDLADASIPESYRNVAESGEPYYTEQVDYDEQGIKGAFEVSAVKIGKNQMVAFFRDVTDRKMAEEKLRESEAKFRELADMLPQIVFETDAEAKLIFANQNAFEIFGYTKDDLEMGLSATQMIAPKDRKHAADRMLQIMTGLNNLAGYEYTAIKKDGTEFPVVIYSRRFLRGGKLAGLRGIMIDITDRKRIEEALKESKTFLENMTDVAYMADDRGNIVWVNPAAERVTGLPPEEMIGRPFVPLFIEADHDPLMDVYKKTLDGESLENTLTFKSGVTCHFSSLPKRNPQGDIIGTFGVARDISDRLAAERALQISEARLKKAQAMAKVGNWEYDIVTGKVWGSVETFRIFGIERTSEFLPLDEVESYIIDAKRVNQALVDLVAQNKAYDIEFQINLKNLKELTYVHSMAELVYDGDGKPEKVVGVIQDITEPKQAEEILHKSHEMLKRTEAMANIGSWEWDVLHDRARWSEELFRIFGRDPAESAPSFAEQSEFYVNGDMQRLRDAVEICVKRGTPYEIELRAIRTDGEIRHCVSRGQPQYDENGKVFRIAGSFQDITARKHSEHQIKSLERQNQALLDHSPVCHIIVDLDFNLKYMSVNGFKMLKLDENSEIYGKPYPFYFFPEAFQNEMKKKLKKVIDTGETITMEALTNDFQENDVWLESSLIPVFDDGNNIEYITIVSANVTQRKRDEKEKAHLEGQLRQAQKMEAVGRLAGGVAHDFNNMLSVIIGHAGMAMEDVSLSLPIYERLKEIKKAGERSADLTRQLLAFARKQTVSPKVLDLNQTVGSMSNMLQRLIGEHIDLLWLPGEDVWSVKVDPSQIDQILANLCVNARDAIADVGKVTIETGNVAFDEAYCSEHPVFNPGEYVLLAVSDNGCGMDAGTLGNIFEPFFTTKGPGKGTGLGLATVYGVVKQNDGFVNVYSEPGQGTTFKIYLPRYKAKADLLQKDVKRIPTELGHETILLVEDEIAILRLTTQMLERLGYNVVAAKTPGEAIHLAQEHTGEIHLLVTDVVMPEMNGRDLAKNILSIYPKVNRLFMSGYNANVIAHHGVLDEGVNFVQKPFSMDQLSAKVREALDSGET